MFRSVIKLWAIKFVYFQHVSTIWMMANGNAASIYCFKRKSNLQTIWNTNQKQYRPTNSEVFLIQLSIISVLKLKSSLTFINLLLTIIIAITRNLNPPLNFFLSKNAKLYWMIHSSSIIMCLSYMSFSKKRKKQILWNPNKHFNRKLLSFTVIYCSVWFYFVFI